MCFGGKIKSSLKDYTYSCGGGMCGGYHRETVKKVDEIKALISITGKDWHYMDETVSEYYVPVSILDDIKAVFNKTHMKRYSKLKNSKFFACDAATSSYRFWFENGKDVGFGSNQRIPRKGYAALKEIDEIISQAIQKTEKLPGLVLPEPPVDEEERQEFYRHIESGKITFQVYNYYADQIEFRISNGLEDKVEISGEIQIFKLTDGKEELLSSCGSLRRKDIPANYCHNDYTKIHCERFAIGDYKLKIGELETLFQIR